MVKHVLLKIYFFSLERYFCLTLNSKLADKLDKRIEIPKNIFSWLEEWVIYLEFQMVKGSLERNQNPKLALFSGVESKFITTYRLQEAHTENSIHTLT